MGTAPRTSLLSAIVLLLACPAIARAQEPAPVVREGKHFRIEVHPGKVPAEPGGRLADEALAAAESCWPVLEKVLSVRACKPATIHVHCDVAAYRAVEKQKVQGKVLLEAFTQPDGLASHVLLSPRLSARVLARIGLPSPTAQNVILMAAQLVACQQFTAPQTDPGSVALIALGVLEMVTNPGHQFGIDVPYDNRRCWIGGRRDLTPAPELRKIVAYVDTPTREAWDLRQGQLALAAQLLAAADAAWARKLIAKVRARKASVTADDARLAGVEAVLGVDWPRTQQKFTKLCSALRPAWEQSSPMMVRQGQRWLLVGEDDRSASIYAIEPPPPGDYVLAATIEMEAEAPEPEVRLQVDWTGTDLIGVLLEPSYAWLAYFSTASGKWEKLVDAKTTIVAGQRFDVKIEVTKAHLRVVLDGKEVLTWACDKRDMHGKWSVACGDTIVWIEGMRVEPLVPAKK